MLRPSYRWSMNRLVIFAIDIDDVTLDGSWQVRQIRQVPDSDSLVAQLVPEVP